MTPVAADSKGFPDLLLLRDRVLVAEVKARQKQDHGYAVSREQRDWLQAFAVAGAESVVWTVNDWKQGEVEKVLRAR
jgi:hypothetical protein